MDLKTLSICEIFESVQGETSLAGIPTTFIRLALCPLRCSWCDSTYAHAQGQTTPVETIISTVAAYGWKHVCVTGGEPLFQAATLPLLGHLVENAYVVSLETSGAFCIKDIPDGVKIILDVKCPASGMSHTTKTSNLELLDHNDEVKFVIADRTDYEYARECTRKYHLFSKTPNVLISPVFDSLDPQQLVAWALKDHLPFRLNLQIHKYVWGSTTRGV